MTSPPRSTLRLQMDHLVGRLDHLPLWPAQWLARIGIGALFWSSGQTKIEGFQADLLNGQFTLGWPRLSAGAIALFRDEYHLPVLPPELAATLAASAEHLLPLMLVLGLGTRVAAAGLLGMTLVIQLFVYPGAWPTHASWAALLLLLILRGAGPLALERRWRSA